VAAKVCQGGMEQVEDSNAQGTPYAQDDMQGVPTMASARDVFCVDEVV